MGNKVDILEEIRSRLSTATGTGKDLAIFNHVRIGHYEETRQNENYPIIIISLENGTEEFECLSFASDEMSILIKAIISKKADETNRLYKTTDTSGAVYYLEKILNVLDKNTAGKVDLTYNNKAYGLRGYSYSISQQRDLIIIDINISVKTAKFGAGSR